MAFFTGQTRGEPVKYPDKNLSGYGRVPTINSTQSSQRFSKLQDFFVKTKHGHLFLCYEADQKHQWLKHPAGPDRIFPQMKFEMKLSNAVFNIPETGETRLQEII